MSIFSKQVVYCPVCGTRHESAIEHIRAYVLCCSKACSEELTWREVLSVRGKAYYPHPERPYTPPAGSPAAEELSRQQGDMERLELGG